MDEQTRQRVAEAIEMLQELGVNESGIKQCFAARTDKESALEVVERQLRWQPFRDPPARGSVSGQILQAIKGDWSAPARWLALQVKRRKAVAEAEEPYDRPPIAPGEQPAPVTWSEREERLLLQAYLALPSRLVALPEGGCVRECPCPGEEWAARTERLREILGVEPWRDYSGVEGVRRSEGPGLGRALAVAVGGGAGPGREEPA